MSIDAHVAYVKLREDGSGTLHLCDRVPEGSRGQSRLRFDSAPYDVTALNGLPIWGGDSTIMLGEREIAKRRGYTRISFAEGEVFTAAVVEYHQRHRDDWKKFCVNHNGFSGPTSRCPTCSPTRADEDGRT